MLVLNGKFDEHSFIDYGILYVILKEKLTIRASAMFHEKALRTHGHTDGRTDGQTLL